MCLASTANMRVIKQPSIYVAPFITGRFKHFTQSSESTHESYQSNISGRNAALSIIGAIHTTPEHKSLQKITEKSRENQVRLVVHLQN